MKRILYLLVIIVLLCGCATTPPDLETSPSALPPSTSVTAPPPTLMTTPPETEPAEPEEPLNALLTALTTEEKVGQLFLARCPDVDAVADIQKYHLGGYILFTRDFEGQTPESVTDILQSYQAAAKIPLLIAVDEEGGTVNRVSRFKDFRDAPFRSPRDLYAEGGLSLIESNEAEKCALLRSLGINLNAAPVCDVATDPHAFMFARSLGQSPEITGAFVKTVVNTMHTQNIGGILKHFPGYGNNTDTHTGIALDSRPLSQLEAADLVPFAAGIEAGCDAIMISHTIVNAMDPDTPASLSAPVHTYLREKMRFEGVIVTDDLIMQAITDVYGVGESAVLAVQAGNDLLCASDYQEQYPAVLEAVRDGRIAEDTLNQAVLRILRWKQSLGLLK